MIVCDLNVVGIVLMPDETNPVLVVDSDAVLPATIPTQFFQAVAGRESQVIKFKRSVQHREFPPG